MSAPLRGAVLTSSFLGTEAKIPAKLRAAMLSCPLAWLPPRASFTCPARPLANAMEYGFTICTASKLNAPLTSRAPVALAATLKVSVTTATLLPVTCAAV